jgi:hypothetical protein
MPQIEVKQITESICVPQRLNSNSNKPYISAFKKVGYCGGQISLTWRCRRHVGASNFEFHAYHQSKGQQCCTFNRFNTSASNEKLTAELICSLSDGTYRVPTWIEPSKGAFNNLMAVEESQEEGTFEVWDIARVIHMIFILWSNIY